MKEGKAESVRWENWREGIRASERKKITESWRPVP